MAYLIYNTKEEALNRSDQAGNDLGMAYHKGDLTGTRYAGRVFKTTSSKYAWEIEGPLSASEELQKVNTATEDTSESGYEQIVYPD